LTKAWLSWTGVLEASVVYRHQVHQMLSQARFLMSQSAFAQWRDKVADTVRLRHIIKRSVARMNSGMASRSFCAWLAHVGDIRRVKEIVAVVVVRLTMVKQGVAVRQWASAVHALIGQRQALDRTFKRREIALLCASLATWQERTKVEIRLRYLLHRATYRITSRRIICAFHMWLEFASTSKRLQAIGTLVVTQLAYRNLNVAWEQWIRFIAEQHALGIQMLMEASTPVQSVSTNTSTSLRTPSYRQHSITPQRSVAVAQVSVPRHRAPQRPLFLDSLSPPVATSATRMPTNGIDRSQRPIYSHEEPASLQPPTMAPNRAETLSTRWMPLVSKFVALTVMFLCCFFLLETLVDSPDEHNPKRQSESAATTTHAPETQATDGNGTTGPAVPRPKVLEVPGGEDVGRLSLSVEDLVSLTILVPSLVYLLKSCYAANDPRPSVARPATHPTSPGLHMSSV
jgi:hypothetical protein